MFDIDSCLAEDRFHASIHAHSVEYENCIKASWGFLLNDSALMYFLLDSKFLHLAKIKLISESCFTDEQIWTSDLDGIFDWEKTINVQQASSERKPVGL